MSKIAKIFKWVTLLCVAIFIIAFAVVNRESVTIGFPLVSSQLEMPVYVFFFTILILGVLLGSMFAMIYRFRAFRNVRSRDKHIHALETELASLKLEPKILPPEDEANG